MIPTDWVPSVRFQAPTCTVDGCTRVVHACGWCNTHYRRMRRTGSLESRRGTRNGRPAVCSIEGCEEAHYGLGWCRRHWYHARVNGDPYAAPEDILPNPWVDVAPSCPEGHPPPDVFLWHPAPEDGGRWYCRVCIRRFND